MEQQNDDGEKKNCIYSCPNPTVSLQKGQFNEQT